MQPTLLGFIERFSLSYHILRPLDIFRPEYLRNIPFEHLSLLALLHLFEYKTNILHRAKRIDIIFEIL